MILSIKLNLKGRFRAVGKVIFSSLFIVFMMSANQVISQGTSEKYNAEIIECASDMIHQRMLMEDQGYRQRHETMERSIESQSIHSEDQRMVIYTIPVVVHIIHTGENIGTGANITDAQVQSAINALNEDYRRMQGTNGFGAGVDCEIEFCLASRDPQGNPTNGIMRVNGSSVTNYATQGMSVGQGSGASETAVKDLSRWDRDDYYNIWIVNEIEDNDGGAGIQGFAYFPSSSANRDGAVILYNAFGTVGNLKSYTALNRTTSHELWHAFSLYHTFQGNSCTESNCSTDGDRVCDTPPTTSSTSCASPACSGTQQVENYMDYTSQTCMDMFTSGQKTKMRDAIVSQRGSLLTSLGCTPPNALDAGISGITSPSGFSCSGSFSPVVQLSNFGASTLTSVNIKYRVDSGTNQTYSYSGNIPSGGNIEVILPSINVGNGAHSFIAFTQSPNGQTDGYSPNDQSASDFSVVSGSTVTVAIQIDNYGTETTWDVKTSSGTIVAYGGPYPSGMYGTTFEHDFCLAEGCYDFTIYDSYGDGLCCGGGFGGYEVTNENGTPLAQSGTDFTTYETTQICVTATTNTGTTPTANFNVDNTTGCAGTQFQFSDQSSGTPTSRLWTFQGGSPSTSTSLNPLVTFTSAGPHNVTLTVSNVYGSDSEVKNNYVIVTTLATLTAMSTSPSCWNSSNGNVNLNVSGGTAPFTYSWSNGPTTQDINNLTGGTYTVTVNDAAGCSNNATYTIANPSAINAGNSSSTPASCSSNGTAAVIPSGGTGSYSYLWNDPQSQTTQTAVNLASGDHTVVITDANGCQKNKSITVASAGGVNTVSAGLQDVTCNGANNGMAAVSAFGGVGPYSYIWNDFASQTTATASNLAAGTYGVQVTDANGCTSTRSFTVAQPAVLVAGLTSTAAQCFSTGTGAIQASITGGTEPYAFNWNGAGFGVTLNPTTVAAGVYTFNVTDNNGCITTQNISVTEPAAISATILATSPDSCQLDVGTAEIGVTGGTGSYSVAWNDQDAQEGMFLQNVRHGAYVAHIVDDNACVKNKNIVIQELECIGTNTGVVQNLVFGGMQLYPNPLHGNVLTIELGEFLTGPVRVTLMDITGQSIQQVQLSMGSAKHLFTIEESVAEGMYLVQLSDGQHAITQRVMVIR